jgi:hypothetical protein
MEVGTPPVSRVLGRLLFFLLFAYFTSRVAIALAKLQGRKLYQTIAVVYIHKLKLS